MAQTCVLEREEGGYNNFGYIKIPEGILKYENKQIIL